MNSTALPLIINNSLKDCDKINHQQKFKAQGQQQVSFSEYTSGILRLGDFDCVNGSIETVHFNTEIQGIKTVLKQCNCCFNVDFARISSL